MIVDKRPPIPDDDTPVEAPPAYYDALGSTYPPHEKSEGPSDETSAGTLGTTSPEPLSLKSPSSEHGKSSPGWFTFGIRARTAKQVREIVMGLMRDLVKQPQIDRSTISIIENCADACRSYGLSMSSILQEPFAENHTLIYWAIIKRTPEHLAPTDNSSPDLVSVLLSLAAPLTDATISEIRLACLHNSDHVLFQRLRHSPAFAPLSGTEEMLLGGSIPPDEIEVQDVVDDDDDDDAAFIARFRVPMFQKRLRVSKQINLEFIARGRLWSLKFLVASADNTRLRPIASPGTWFVTLSLLEHSPPTEIDSQLIVEDVIPPAEESPASPSTSRIPARGKVRSPITLKLQTDSQPLMSERYRNYVAASFKDNPLAQSLQYDGTSYIGADGSLVASLEARLGQHNAECVIC